MGIQGISDYGNLFQNYRVPSIPSVDIEQVKKQNETVPSISTNSEEATSLTTTTVNEASRTADLENVSINFNSKDDYSYIGSESDLGNLDMQKAISDMRKDQVLEQYQYFVGSSKNLTESMGTEDGIFFPKFEIY